MNIKDLRKKSIYIIIAFAIMVSEISCTYMQTLLYDMTDKELSLARIVQISDFKIQKIVNAQELIQTKSINRAYDDSAKIIQCRPDLRLCMGLIPSDSINKFLVFMTFMKHKLSEIINLSRLRIINYIYSQDGAKDSCHIF